MVPIFAQPKGRKYLLGTWTGRLILINSFVFILMSIQSKSFVLPDESILLSWGAKDPILLAQGQIWRLITPIFVHIGIVHFAFNTWALHVVAYQIEALMSGKWFLVLYLLSGLIGNIASSVFSLSVSAGASSSLFGLLGCGFYLERLIRKRFQQQTGRKPKSGAYTAMVVANIALGFMIPQIDNAAHLGGLAGGIAITFLIFRYVPNNLLAQNRRQVWIGAGALVVIVVAGTLLASSPQNIRKRLMQGYESTSNTAEKYHFLSDLIRLDGTNPDIHMKRGLLLLGAGENEEAIPDLKAASQNEENKKKLIDMRDYYKNIQDGDKEGALEKALNSSNR